MNRRLTVSLCTLMVAALLAPTAWAAPAPAASTLPATSSAATTAAVVRLEGTIDNHTRDGFFTRFERARASGARVVVVDLDTYGGLVTAGLEISQFLKRQDGVRTVAYVGHKAISAGAMIALACDEIVMAPGAQLGDCAPIAMREDGSLQSMGDAERAKQESPILSDFRESAQRNGYDPLLAQAMVSMRVVVWWAQSPAGERRFVDQKEFEELSKKGWTAVRDPDVPTPVDSESTLLTVTGAAAAKLGLARGLQSNVASLARDRNYDVVATFAPAAGDKLIEWLNNPFARMLLMMVFAQCLYAAVHAPGHGFAEVLALLALTILVGVPLLTGYAQWWEIIVLLVGVVLLALELFVIPGFGVTGILGLLMILFALVMTFVGGEPAGPGFMPRLEGTWTNVRSGLTMVTAALVGSIFVSMWLRRYLPRLPYLNRLILTATTGNMGEAAIAGLGGAGATVDDYRPAVGAIGQTVSELKPGGSATFFDPVMGENRVFSVLSDVGYVEPGTRVAVRNNGDNRVVVRPVV